MASALTAKPPTPVHSLPALPSAADLLPTDSCADGEIDPLLLALARLTDPLPDVLAGVLKGIRAADVEIWDAACLKERLIWAFARIEAAEEEHNGKHEATVVAFKAEDPVKAQNLVELGTQTEPVTISEVTDREQLSRAEARIKSLERELERVASHHGEVVEGLWGEVKRVQEEYAALSYKHVMGLTSEKTPRETPPRIVQNASGAAQHSPMSTFISAGFFMGAPQGEGSNDTSRITQRTTSISATN
ncbi:hypothetical protein HDU93_004416, partial [Gonapodya sp. JEL0774]